MNLCVQYNYSGTPAHETLYRVQQSYTKVHPYLSLVICSFGILSNVVNILVLTKPSMRNSINCILTGVAVADMITMTSYIPFVYYYYIMDPEYSHTSLGWKTFMAVHMNLTLTSHTSSIWLGVIMAALRYFFVRPTSARGARTLDCRSTLVLIVLTYLGAALLLIPNCLATEIEPCFNNSTGLVNWHLKQPSFGGSDSNMLHTITFFIYPVVGKIIPCTLISIFGGLLLHTLRETNRRSRRLKGGGDASSHKKKNSSAGIANGGGRGGGGGGGGGSSQARRTTVMLLAIIALYIISELPQSILVLLCIFVEGFFQNVYGALGDFIDLLSLINSAINFITYTAMSTQFRETLLDMFAPCWKPLAKSCRAAGGSQNALQSVRYSKTPPAEV
ncbi:hypothetical protein EGW08_013590 [Elysia chlorotica]|uniref:G-protein coupled receptors family 1 profile domain-containing protein n=1 Tax=Elysia chlorotica TaxID=188477 RepID=A0A3S1BZ32_ELYCH|nr:hypothetical protein EGW08_013590 [Elysia chlorotica]